MLEYKISSCYHMPNEMPRLGNNNMIFREYREVTVAVVMLQTVIVIQSFLTSSTFYDVIAGIYQELFSPQVQTVSVSQGRRAPPSNIMSSSTEFYISYHYKFCTGGVYVVTARFYRSQPPTRSKAKINWTYGVWTFTANPLSTSYLLAYL